MQHIQMISNILILLQLLQSIKATTFLEIRKTQDYDFIVDDEGSGSDNDASFWVPKLMSGESFVSFVNTFGYSEPTNIISIIITDSPPNVLKEPKNFIEIWNDAGSHGDDDIYFYEPVPYIDYHCFGDFISDSSSPRDSDYYENYKCIHKDYVQQLSSNNVRQTKMWNDKGSGADDNGQVIKIDVPYYPYNYFRTRQGYASTVEGPFYSFNTYSRYCKVIKVDTDSSSTSQILTSVAADLWTTIEYKNYGTNLGETQGFGVNKCEDSISSFTHTRGSKQSFSYTYGYSITQSAEAIGFEQTLSAELSVGAEFSQEYSETTTTEFETCSNIPEQEIPCPGRTKCQRDYIVYTASNTNVPIYINVQCDINEPIEIIEGEFKATGAAHILVQDIFIPLDCPYYTDDYADRKNGKLPFCDTCYETNECIICRDGMVLINGECYEDRICIEECGGIINSPSQTVPHSTEPDFAGRYCVDEEINEQSCINALTKFD